MPTRTTRTTVTFTKPFVLGDLDEVLPAGDYLVDTDEELLQGLSFNAFRRVLTIVHLPDISGNPMLSRALTIDQHLLDAALKRDHGPSEPSAVQGALRPSAERLAGERAENEGMATRAR